MVLLATLHFAGLFCNELYPSSSLLQKESDATKVRLASPDKRFEQNSKKVDLQPHRNYYMNRKSFKRVDSFVERIVGGYPAPVSTFIHLASISVDKSNGDRTSCTGTILNSTTVLSASHCFPSGDSGPSVEGAEIRFRGLSNRGTAYTVKSIVIYKRFQKTLYGHDIAIVTLFRSIDKTFKPIGFPTCSKCFPQSGQRMFAAGFGRTGDKRTEAGRLMETSLVVHPFALCKRTYSSISQTRFGRFHMFCAMDDEFPESADTGVCFADSGGPVFIKKGKSGFVQMGITSFGPGECIKKGGVDWFVNLSLYQSVIKRFLRGRDIQWRSVYHHSDA